jgi:hypothetical protein
MEKAKKFQIALLIEDISEAKIISDGLREIGVYAHYYQDLDDLWVSLNTYTPDLCIVDVKKMSQKNLLFKQHPKVKNNSLKFSFYYKKSTQMLLNSTHGMAHYGLIRAELNINDQLKAIVKRRCDELDLVEQNKTLKLRIERLKSRSNSLTKNIEQSQETLAGFESVVSLMNDFGQVSDIDSFKSRMAHILSQWKACDTFGFYQLNSTGQKLVSPQARGTKFNTLPDLWLSQNSDAGIKKYALEMAFDVAYGVLGDELTVVKVHGKNDEPEMVIFLQMNQSISQVSLQYLEEKLSSSYRKVLLQNTNEKNRENAQDIFSVLHTLDEQQFFKAQVDKRFVLVDFSELINLVKQRNGNRFYWKTFSREFVTEVSAILGSETVISNYGAEYFLIGIEKSKIEENFNKLKSYTQDFQYWRYFEDTSFIVGNDVSPVVRFISPSSVSLLRSLDDGFQDIMTATRSQHTPHLEV